MTKTLSLMKVSAAVGTLWVAGCEGALGGHSQDDAPVPFADESPGDALAPAPGAEILATDACSGDLELGAVPMRRLTTLEYERTVEALFGVVPETAHSFLPDDGSSAFTSNSVSPLTTRHLELYLDAAEEVADAAEPADWLPECESEEVECTVSSLGALVRRVFRRPALDEEVDELTEGLRAAQDEGGVAVAHRYLILALLTSPSFLYRPEIPPQGQPHQPLTPYELATRLSYLLWSSPPDESLLDAAGAGLLESDEGLREQALRLLEDPRAEASVRSFHDQWLGVVRLPSITKDEALYPQFSEELKTSMAEETARFSVDVFLNESGEFSDLLTAQHSFIDSRLAELYGVDSPATDFERVQLPPGERSGVLTHASVLATQALAAEPSPILRGKFVRQTLFCQGIPEPPPDVDITPPEIDPSLTTKERFEQHRADPACSACHDMMDPIGFGFQHYDAIGAWTDADGDQPVDATGELMNTDVDGPFDGARELGARIATSSSAQFCYQQQWLRYALGRVEQEGERCSLAESLSAGRPKTLKDAVLALIASDTFRMKSVHLAESGERDE